MDKKRLLLFGAIGAGVYLLTKKSAAAATPPGVPAPVDLDHEYFNKMKTLLEADPIWLQGSGFPANFYEYVEADNAQRENGVWRDPEYQYGLPGSFMSVADAWMSAMQYSQATHAGLWRLYSEYRSKLATQNL